MNNTDVISMRFYKCVDAIHFIVILIMQNGYILWIYEYVI